MHKKQFGIIYIERNGFSYYSQGINQSTFSFPQDAVHEIEVTNEDALTKAITEFISANKFPSATAVIILSADILYEKEIPDQLLTPEKPDNSPSEERMRKIQVFTDTVPFEEIGSKSYKIDKGIKVIATNKHLYMLVKSAFVKQGFFIDTVIPITMIGKDLMPNLGMTQDVANKLFSKFELFRQNNFLEESPVELGGTAIPVRGIQMTTKVTSKREFALIGVFGCLLLILGSVTYITFFATPKPKQIASMSKKVVPTVSLTPMASATATLVASESARINKESLKVQINGGSQLQADLLKQQLLNSGYTTIALKPGNVAATGKAFVIFAKIVPAVTREIFITELKKSLLQVTVQEGETTDEDAVVNL